MRYPLQLEGFEGQTVEVQPFGVLTGPKLLVNGQPAGPGLRRGHVVLGRNDGREVIATLLYQFLAQTL